MPIYYCVTRAKNKAYKSLIAEAIGAKFARRVLSLFVNARQRKLYIPAVGVQDRGAGTNSYFQGFQKRRLCSQRRALLVQEIKLANDQNSLAEDRK
jgi:hypothetical protein